MKENKGRMSRNKNVSMYVGAFNIIMLLILTLHFAYMWNNVYNTMLKTPFMGSGNKLMVFTIFLLIFVTYKMWGGCILTVPCTYNNGNWRISYNSFNSGTS